jgi:hypothetical protein
VSVLVGASAAAPWHLPSLAQMRPEAQSESLAHPTGTVDVLQ